MTLSPSLKIPLLLANPIFLHFSVSPPPVSSSPPATEDERRKYSNEDKSDLLSSVHGWILVILRVIFTMMCIGEAYLIMYAKYRCDPPQLFISPVLATVFPSSSLASAPHISLSSTFLLGTILIYLGTTVRRLCYRYLGRFFTFELALRRDHELITTGPYSIIRHPAYSGQLLVNIGIVFTELGSGSMWTECNMWSVPFWKFIGTCWCALWLFGTVSMFKRTWKEDEVLRKEFGKRWDMWAQHTQFKLIPFVF